MPTPFYHLSLALDLRVGAAASLPAAAWGPYCLGHVAPDAQTVSGQTRTATHFFDVPMRDATPAWRAMFRLHPELSRPAGLAPERAAFLAGYLCHLALDQLWIEEIFDPIFGEEAAWATFPERLFLHNVLRVYLDRLDLPRLTNGMQADLNAVQPWGWLPFLADDALRRWRDFVAGQLVEGAASQTIAVFAGRMGRPPTDFESLLQSPADMQARLFDRLPFDRLADFRRRGLERCSSLTAAYLSGEKV